jgi:hypothetical protein
MSTSSSVSINVFKLMCCNGLYHQNEEKINHNLPQIALKELKKQVSEFCGLDGLLHELIRMVMFTG